MIVSSKKCALHTRRYEIKGYKNGYRTQGCDELKNVFSF